MTTPDMKSWTEPQKAAYLAAQADLEQESQALADLEAEAKAAREAPEAVTAALVAASKKTRAARELAAKERKADAVYAETVGKYGDERVARVRTVRGSIILRPMTLAEVDADTMSAKDLEGLDVIKFGREQVKRLAVYPEASEIDDIAEAYVGLWGELFMARDATAAAVRGDVAKKG